MYNFSFKITNDGSVGLYDEEEKDILHSVTGALKESFDKFIYPTGFEKFCHDNFFVNILDICYGIGYNTKTAIYSALKNNKNIKINISALDINRELAFLSPFVKDKLNSPDINLYLLSYFIYNFSDFSAYISDFFNSASFDKEEYFTKEICLVLDKFIKSRYIFDSQKDLLLFLHNIYYQNISYSMKNDFDISKYSNIHFEIKFGDARATIQSLNYKYNFVFLDGYTPHKQPLLWTYDFLSVIKSKMYSDGILSTYSNSTPVRKSLNDLNFFVGKIILDNSQFGTVASLNKDNIKHELSDYDIGLMNTKAGIPYLDDKFMLSSKQILLNREEIVKTSNKQSATEYKKRYKNAI